MSYISRSWSRSLKTLIKNKHSQLNLILWFFFRKSGCIFINPLKITHKHVTCLQSYHSCLYHQLNKRYRQQWSRFSANKNKWQEYDIIYHNNNINNTNSQGWSSRNKKMKEKKKVLKSITSIKRSSCFLSCYQAWCDSIEQEITLFCFTPRLSHDCHMCCRIIFCIERAEKTMEKMTMMSTGCHRKITFYDGIIEKSWEIFVGDVKLIVLFARCDRFIGSKARIVEKRKFRSQDEYESKDHVLGIIQVMCNVYFFIAGI